MRERDGRGPATSATVLFETRNQIEQGAGFRRSPAPAIESKSAALYASRLAIDTALPDASPRLLVVVAFGVTSQVDVEMRGRMDWDALGSGRTILHVAQR